jgi:hypothetical protein
VYLSDRGVTIEQEIQPKSDFRGRKVTADELSALPPRKVRPARITFTAEQWAQAVATVTRAQGGTA